MPTPARLLDSRDVRVESASQREGSERKRTIGPLTQHRRFRARWFEMPGAAQRTGLGRGRRTWAGEGNNAVPPESELRCSGCASKTGAVFAAPWRVGPVSVKFIQ
jgi:hypothetical protein